MNRFVILRHTGAPGPAEAHEYSWSHPGAGVTTSQSLGDAPAGSNDRVEPPEAVASVQGILKHVITAAGTPRDTLRRMRRRKIAAASYPVSLAEIDRLLDQAAI